MWGQILVESSIQQNFNFGFSTHKSDILLHLSQWQYWWWFWFSLIWVAYYYIIIYSITKRTFLFNPVINTSIRGHGKWGDFLVALIPLSWCGNILVNSNFILRMIEWQNESSLFTLRVQGKQWYWVYKFDGNASTSIFSAPKNIGHNKWLTWFSNDVYISDSYYQAIHLSSQLEFQDTYKTLLEKNSINKNNLELNLLASNKLTNLNTPEEYIIKFKNIFLLKTNNYNKLFTLNYITDVNFIEKSLSELTIKYNLLIDKLSYLILGDINFSYKTIFKNIKKTQIIAHYDLNRIDDTSDTMGNIRLENINYPLRLLKLPLNNYNLDLINADNSLKFNTLFNFKYNNSNDQGSLKIQQTETLWGFRQKKYKRLKKFLFKPRFNYNPVTYEPTSQQANKIFSSQRNIKNSQFLDLRENNSILEDNILVLNKNFSDKYSANSSNSLNNLKVTNQLKLENSSLNNSFDYYKSIKNSKHRTDLLSVTLARRLLRVKRTLVLPAHVNITVITNSYDVVHSWFIPGLGIKLDCVPGRSTHHTFYIDNIGFYYGQCAEICGRYHHHMPIRICALSFEQFLVWWHKKGLPRLNRLNIQGQVDSSSKYYNSLHNSVLSKDYTLYKYNW